MEQVHSGICETGQFQTTKFQTTTNNNKVETVSITPGAPFTNMDK